MRCPREHKDQMTCPGGIGSEGPGLVSTALAGQRGHMAFSPTAALGTNTKMLVRWKNGGPAGCDRPSAESMAPRAPHPPTVRLCFLQDLAAAVWAGGPGFGWGQASWLSVGSRQDRGCGSGSTATTGRAARHPWGRRAGSGVSVFFPVNISWSAAAC